MKIDLILGYEMEKTVWVLGSKHHSAHKSISWGSPFPNLADCDILIINLQSLEGELIREQVDKFYVNARRHIFDLLMAGENEVIVILTPEKNNFDWLPLFPNVKEVTEIGVTKNGAASHIAEYMKTVEKCSFYIHTFNSDFFVRKTDPEYSEHENYFFTHEARGEYRSGVYLASRIVNKAKQMIGGRLNFLIDFGYKLQKQFSSGDLYLLPPPTKCKAEKAIDIMLSSLTGGKLIESPPSWEAKIDMPGLKNFSDQIVQKEMEKEKLIKDIEMLKSHKDKLIKFRRLLWTDSTTLENVVRDAFVTLGFSEIRRIRARNQEDWVIDLKYVPEYKYGVFEVKGSETRTTLSDMNQCDKWVKDYLLEKDLQVKGIFVPNQYRRGDVKNNLGKREHFEPNELKFASLREICILPSHELFFAAVEKIKGNTQFTRKYVEEKIVNSKGICKLGTD